MIQITEQQISTLATNASAMANAKKIVQKGGFVKLSASADGTFYLGECSGSGKTNYITSADYINESEPVFRCSCPSRQFPCKHSLALLMEIKDGKTFTTCEIPEDIMDKRAKKEARVEKKAEKKTTPPKTNKNAAAKKLKKQLEGLDLTEQMMQELLNAGLGTLTGNSVGNYKDLAKQLGDYYLPGPQLYVNRLILNIEQMHRDSDNRHYEEAVKILVKLHALVKKSKEYLNEKLNTENLEQEDTILYEELGGVWQLDQLNALNLKKDNARLIQLSFQVIYDEAKKEYTDLGYWADIDTGEIFSTYNYRPLKALKYVKEEDTIFDMAVIPQLTYYPGNLNKRVRWENASYTPVTPEHLALLKEKAGKDIASVVKQVKNQIKNTLADDYVVHLLAFKNMAACGEDYVLEDNTGETIRLSDMDGMESTVYRLSMVPHYSMLENQLLLGAFYCDEKNKKMCIKPISIVTDKTILRLLY